MTVLVLRRTARDFNKRLGLRRPPRVLPFNPNDKPRRQAARWQAPIPGTENVFAFRRYGARVTATTLSDMSAAAVGQEAANG